MNEIGSQIKVEGTLLRDGASFAIRGQRGVIFHLQLQRVPVDHVEKRVRVKGVLIAQFVIEAEGVTSI